MIARQLGIALLMLTAAFVPVSARSTPRSHDNVLVLIEPGRYDPAVDPSTYIHPTWVRWPDQSPPSAAAVGSDSRLLSLMSGLDWRATLPLSQFRLAGEGKALPAGDFRRLIARGYFDARRINLGGAATSLLVGHSGATPVSAMLLALNESSPVVSPVTLRDPWPTGQLMVLRASDGADVNDVLRRTTGRVLVIEYPPGVAAPASAPSTPHPTDVGPNWSRFWLAGIGGETSPDRRGWPDGLPEERELGVPGLIRASSLATLVLRPSEFTWRPAPAAWTGANRWFAYVQSTRPTALFVLFIAFVVTTFLVATHAAQEKRSVLLCGAARGFSLVPAACVVGGNCSRIAGLTGGVVWIGIAWLALAGAAAVINVVSARASDWEPLVGYALAGFVPLLILDPRFSILGTVFEHGAVVVPGEAFGAALAAFAALSMTLGESGPKGIALVAAVTFALVAVTAWLRPWWWNGTAPFGAWWLIAAATGLGFRAAAWWLVPAAVSLRLWAIYAVGFSFLPSGLVDNLRQVGSINLAEIPRFLLSPVVVGSFFLTVALALYASQFLAHQVRTVWRERSLARLLGTLAAACFAGGLIEPVLLRSGVICAFGAVIVVLEDLMRPRELVD